MRKLIVLEFITLDGVIQAGGAPDEDRSNGFKYGGWQAPYSDEVIREEMQEQMKQPFSLLLGRKTYDIFAAYWPFHEDAWPGIRDTIKYVASNNPDFKPEWDNSVLLTGDIVEQIKKIKSEDGPNLHVFGSSNLVQTLMKNDLVDEMKLKIYPITLGSGKKLFVEGTIPATFKLLRSRVSPSGIIIVDYERAGEVKTGTLE